MMIAELEHAETEADDLQHSFELHLHDTETGESALPPKFKNQRKTVRYVRKDITAFISKPDIFGFYCLFSCSRPIRVKLLDVSSRGVLVALPSKMRLKLHKKVRLTLIFNSNKKFEIPCRVVRQLIPGRRFYGVAFEKVNENLGDYLLESQAELVFK